MGFASLKIIKGTRKAKFRYIPTDPDNPKRTIITNTNGVIEIDSDDIVWLNALKSTMETTSMSI